MRRMFLLGLCALLAVSLGFVPTAAAQCNEGLKVGNSFDFAVASEDKTIAGKGTITVTKNDGSFVEFSVKTGEQQLTMPGGVDGGRVILTNPKNGNVWVLTCSAKGVEGTSTLAGKAMKLTFIAKKK